MKIKVSKNVLLGTNERLLSSSLLLLRGTIGIILFVVGAGKLFGWFGGFGLEQTINFYGQAGISVFFSYLSIYTELFGGLLIAVGLLTRVAGFAVVINMLVATIVTLPSGFLAPNGAVLPFTFLICSVIILVAGPLKYSIDELIFRVE